MLLFSLILLAMVGLAIGWLFRGSLRRVTSHLRLSENPERILVEDALKHLYKCELGGQVPSLQSLGGQLNITIDTAAELLSKLQKNDLVEQVQGSFQLTPAGKDYALHVTRAHRLWESYLADNTGLAEVEWHGRAEQVEHTISREEADLLWAQLGHPTHDPHGDPFPTSVGSMASPEGFSLLAAEPGLQGRIIHVEDEPESVYAQLVGEGIYPGMEIQVVDTSSEGVQVLLEGEKRSLSVLAAANVTVEPIPRPGADLSSTNRLSDLRPGEKGCVVTLSRASRTSERRRLMDLGILPGTVIGAELSSIGGDPIAYRVRGALIALRRTQAAQVLVSRLEDNAA